MSARYEKIKRFAIRHAAHAPLVYFCVGAVWDSLTLWKPDGVFENFTFAAYLLITTLIIFILPLFERRSDERASLLIAALQFCLGNLAGGLTVLYIRSGTLSGSAAFLALLFALIIANELLKARYRAHAMRIGVWYALLVLYMSMALPVVYQKIGEEVFIHGLLTAFIIAFFLITVQRMIRFIARPQDWFVSLSVITVVSVFFAFTHATGMMPPVPLALRSAGIAHSAVHIGDIYNLEYEESTYPMIMETSATFNTELPSRAYCFSEVYAPKGLTTNLQHHWEFYDEEQGEWSDVVTVPYSIFGGREKGYRGYSYISLRKYGSYRCTIETDKGVIIGRRTFMVVSGVPVLKTTDF